jgi:hypothetical protein
MAMDYDVRHAARCCAATGREFTPGETYYSVLLAEGADSNRYDYCGDAWQGPPEKAIGWWKTRLPERNPDKKQWAPNDVMLDFWDRLGDQPDKQDIRYVLTLLLARRRVFRLEDENRDAEGHEWVVVSCPRRDATYHVPAAVPDQTRTEQIQEELASLLR